MSTPIDILQRSLKIASACSGVAPQTKLHQCLLAGTLDRAEDFLKQGVQINSSLYHSLLDADYRMARFPQSVFATEQTVQTCKLLFRYHFDVPKHHIHYISHLMYKHWDVMGNATRQAYRDLLMCFVENFKDPPDAVIEIVNDVKLFVDETTAEQLEQKWAIAIVKEAEYREQQHKMLSQRVDEQEELKAYELQKEKDRVPWHVLVQRFFAPPPKYHSF